MTGQPSLFDSSPAVVGTDVADLRERIGRLSKLRPPVVETSSLEPLPRAPRNRGPVGGWVSLPSSDHDHFGQLDYNAERIACRGCGQVWELQRRDGGAPFRWKPDPYQGPSYGRLP